MTMLQETLSFVWTSVQTCVAALQARAEMLHVPGQEDAAIEQSTLYHLGLDAKAAVDVSVRQSGPLF